MTGVRPLHHRAPLLAAIIAVTAVLCLRRLPVAGQLQHLNATLTQARHDLAGTSVGSKALFGGGQTVGSYSSAVTTVDVFDVSTNSWTVSALSVARSLFAATSVGTKALFGGGILASAYSGTTAVDIYDSVTGVWSTAVLSQARGWLVAVSIESHGLAMFAGGGGICCQYTNVDIYNGGNQGSTASPLAVVDIYDASTGKWTTASLSQARSYLAAASIGNTLALFAGGVLASGAASAVVDTYNSITNQWSISQLSVARSYLAGASLGPRALFAGGADSSGSPSNVLDIFNADTGVWTIAHLSTARITLVTAAFASAVLFGGGDIPYPTASAAVDIFVGCCTSSQPVSSLCIPCPCGTLQPVLHATPISGRCDGRISDVCTYGDCIAGYRMSLTIGNRTRVCSPQLRAWTGSAPICEAIVPVLLSLNPSATTLAGNITITAIGLDFLAGIVLTIQNRSLAFLGESLSNRSSLPSSVVFQSPAVALPMTGNGHGFYVALTLTNPSNNVTISNTSALYYLDTTQPSATACLGVGQWWNSQSQSCQACPSSGFCPGGDRIWPLPGSWSPNELAVPQPCALAVACPGVFGSNLPPQYNPDGSRVTSSCAPGYTDAYCSHCATDYYQDNLVCLYCGTTSADHAEFVALVIIGAVLVTVISATIAVLNDRQLGTAVAAIVALQQATAVGGTAASQLSGSAASSFFRYLSLVNLNVQLFKPGCTLPRIGFVELFWATMTMIVCAGACFIMAAAVHARLLSQEPLQTLAVTRFKLFKRRAVHSMMILGTLAYFQFCIRAFQGMACTTSTTGPPLLRVDQTLQCYSDFPTTAVFIFLLFFVYGCGFPAICIWVLYRGVTKSSSSQSHSVSHPRQGEVEMTTERVGGTIGQVDQLRKSSMDSRWSTTSTSSSRSSSKADALTTTTFTLTSPSPSPHPPLQHDPSVLHAELHNPKRAGKYGFLHRGVKDRFWWFRMTSFGISLLLALQQAVASSVSMKTFLAVLGFGLELLGVGLLLPFKTWYSNLAAFGGAYLNAWQVVVCLAFLQDTADTPHRLQLFQASLALLVVLSLVLAAYRTYRFVLVRRLRSTNLAPLPNASKHSDAPLSDIARADSQGRF